jgi:hypothetical protein
MFGLGKNYLRDASNNVVEVSSGVRLSPQTVALHEARISNLRISSATDIVMVLIFLAGFCVIVYYVFYTLHLTN